MKMVKYLLTLSFCTAFLLLPALSSAEVKITLKNGRSMMADSCREAKGKLVCDMAGGTIEFNKQEIESMKEVKVERRAVIDAQPVSSSGTEAGGKEEAEKKMADIQSPAKVGEERIVRGLSPEQTKRLDRINEQKTTMKAERERLIKEREQLHEDVKNAGVVRNQEQFDAIKKRIADLERQIIDFNNKVQSINEEEAKVIEIR